MYVLAALVAYLFGSIPTAYIVVKWRTGWPYALGIVPFFVVLGHNYPVWTRFRGGRGLAVFLTLALIYQWNFVAAWAILWAVVYLLSGYLAVATVVTAVVETLLEGNGMIRGKHLKDAIFAGESLLKKEMDFINAINVYPVADADTGTNMYNTVRGIAELIEHVDEDRADKMAETIAEAGLEAARGNSGTILSQYFWGFAEAVQGKKSLTVSDLAVALEEAKNWAYQAVANPVEGTMLTTMRAAADAARALAYENDVLTFINKVYQNALIALEETPELLAKLGKPKIIDSGAYGYTLILEGLVHAFGGNVQGYRVRGMAAEREEREEDAGSLFCSNYMLDLDDGATAAEIRRAIQQYGDSIVVVGGKGKMKVHIHTDRPGVVRKVLERFGKVVQERIDKIW